MLNYYLHDISQVDQQSVRHRRNIVPDAVPLNLQPADVLVDEKDRQNAGVGVRLDSIDEVWPRTGRVVVEPGKRSSPVADQPDEVVLVEFQDLGRCSEDAVSYSLGFQCVLVQNVPG